MGSAASSKRASRAAVIAVGAALAAPAAAHAGGDPAAGRRKSAVCTACHVANDPPDAPHLVGQRASYLAGELQAFRKRDRANPLMNAIAAQLSDADIADLAAFWSGEPVGSDARPDPPVAAALRSHMVFPRNFPDGFVLYLTTNDAEHATFKKIYINQLGFEAARLGKPLPYGTIIMVVNHAARLGPDGMPVIEHGGWVADRVLAYSGMESRAGWGSDVPEWLRNTSWNYTAFTPARTPNPDVNQAVCLACHKPQALVGYLFTFNELSDAARAR